MLGSLLRNRHSYQWSADGTKLWHPGFDGQVLDWQPHTTSKRPVSLLKEKAPAPKKGSSKRPLSDATNGARSPTEAESQDGGDGFAGVTPQQLQLKAAPASDKLVGHNMGWDGMVT